MSDIAADEKRRRQNRESQRRYRKRQKSKSKDYVVNGSPSHLLISPSDPVWAASNAPTTLPPWVDIHCEEPKLQNTHILGSDVEVFRDPGTMIDYQGLNSPYTSIFGITPPATDLSSVHTQTPMNDQTDIGHDLTLRRDNNMDTQHVLSMRHRSITEFGATPSSVPPPYPVEEYRNEPDICTTPPPPTRNRKSSKSSGDLKYRAEKRQYKAPPTQSENRLPTKPSMPRVSSKAVEMITSVENLYEFGVNIGILPEDKETQLSLRRMKRRFISLLQQPCKSESDSSGDEHTDDEGDDTSVEQDTVTQVSHIG